MNTITLEVVYHIAAHLQQHDLTTGQRWPVLLRSAKRDILKFRGVCRSFRDASWLLFRDVVAERIWYLTVEDVGVLEEIAGHARLGPLITTLTFGGKLFNHDCYTILERQLDYHQLHSPNVRGNSAPETQRSYEQWVDFKELYGQELESQEKYWSSGEATRTLIASLDKLENLTRVQLNPRSHCVVLGDGPSKSKLCFHPWRPGPSQVPQQRVHINCDGWKDVSRILQTLSSRNKPFIDLRASSVSNIRWPISSPIFHPQLFSTLKVLQISIYEDLLVADETYADSSHNSHSSTLSKCLQSSPHLESLDLEICQVDVPDKAYNSLILASLAHTPLPFRLRHLVLEYSCTSQETLSALISPHASTLSRLLLISAWIRPGSWTAWLADMKAAGLFVEYLEIWKPSQGAAHHYVNSEWFDGRLCAEVARRGKIVPFLGVEDMGMGMPVDEGWFEEWGNCSERRGGR